jgi:spermidine synthase
VHITVVELDPVVKEMAEKWFEFRPDSQLKCLVGDGIDFLRTAASEGSLIRN